MGDLEENNEEKKLRRHRDRFPQIIARNYLAHPNFRFASKQQIQ